MAKFRIVKQYTSGSDTIYVSQLSGSSDALYEYNIEDTAYRKMLELEEADSTKRKYKVIEI